MFYIEVVNLLLGLVEPEWQAVIWMSEAANDVFESKAMQCNQISRKDGKMQKLMIVNI